MSVRERRIVPAITLLISPEEIFDYYSPFFALHIRSGTPTHFEMFPLDEFQIDKHFNRYNNEIKNLLYILTPSEVDIEIKRLLRVYTKQKSGMSEVKYLERAGIRYIQDNMTALFRAQPDMPIYHRVKNNKTGNYLIAKCSISLAPVNISFKIERNEKNELCVIPYITIEDNTTPIEQFKRYAFLIEKDARYYFLNTNDRLLLDWLESTDTAQYAQDETAFMKFVVQKLEATHKVDKNNLIQPEIIDTAPINSIFLSELNDSMLLFTPKWNYEGIMVDMPFKPIQEVVKNGTIFQIHRNEEQEKTFLDYVKSLHPNFSKQSTFIYLTFDDAKKKHWFLNTYHQLLEDNVALIGLEMLKYFRYSAHPAVTNLQIKTDENDSLLLQLDISFGKEKIKLAELQKLLRNGQSTILLQDNSIAIFKEDWLSQYATILKHGSIISTNEIKIPKWIYLSLHNGVAKDVLQPVMPQEWQQRWMLWQQIDAEIYPIPATLKATLRPYQHKGYEWITLLSEINAGACLADDMGLGKTLQTIAFLCRRQEQKEKAKHIICCPASLIYNWEKELNKFAPHLSTFVYNGTNRNVENFLQEDIDILICTYGTLRNDIDLLCAIQWDVAVADESQNVKNLQAQSTKALKHINANMRIALSGTPIMNNTFELYAQLEFLVPGLLGGQEFFKKEYAIAIDKFSDEHKIQALQQLTNPFILRRTKKQVAKDLPEKTESIIWCEMGAKQMEFYNEVKETIKDNVLIGIQKSGLQKNKLNVLQGILRLRQICGAAQLLKEYQDENESVKIDVLMQELQQLKDNKALVFSQFKDMLHLIAAACRELQIPYFHFDGDTPIAKRQEMVEQFQSEEDDTKVFLISLKSGNAGLTLTAADYVFLIDPWWNSAVQQQAIDRTHRIGQTKNVFAYKMLCKGTIEEKILQLQEKKQFLSDELVSAEDGFVKNLSEEDIAYLFS